MRHPAPARSDEPVAVAIPTSLPEIAQLVKALYAPGLRPHEVQAVERILQEVQRSQHGWVIANALLDSTDDSVKFFGALTYTVKINTEIQAVSTEDAKKLLSTLLDWTVKSLGGSSLVTKKLLYCLALILINHPGRIWHRPVGQVVSILVDKASSVESARVGLIDLSSLDDCVHRAILYLLQACAEVLEGHESRWAVENAELYSSILEDARDIIMESLVSASQHVQIEGIRSFQAFNSLGDSPAMRQVLSAIIKALNYPHLFNAAATALAEAPALMSMLTAEDRAAIANLFTDPWAQSQLKAMSDDLLDEQPFALVNLVITFAEGSVGSIINEPTDLPAQSILNTMLSLLNIRRDEKDMSAMSLEFWISLFEDLTDQQPDCRAFDDIAGEIARICRQLVQLPDDATISNWSHDSRQEFVSFRGDVANLLDSCYAILHSQIIGSFVQHAFEARAVRDPQNWREIESSLFCIHACSDSFNRSKVVCILLLQLLSGDFIADEIDCYHPLLRQMVLSLIADVAYILEEADAPLNECLAYVFRCVVVPSLSKPASTALYEICARCSNRLVERVDVLIDFFNLVSLSNALEIFVFMRVIRAVSTVVASLHSEEKAFIYTRQFLSPFLQALDPIAHSHGTGKDNQHQARKLLCGLRAFAKGFESPKEYVTLLDNEVAQASCWETPEAMDLKKRIMTAIQNVTEVFDDEDEVLDEACFTIRTGFAESQGPFVFPYDWICQFLCSRKTPRRHGVVISTMSRLLVAVSSRKLPVEGIASDSFQFIAREVLAQNTTSMDPEILQESLEFLDRIVCLSPTTLFSIPIPALCQLMQQFVFLALGQNEKFTQKAAVAFMV